MNAQILQRASYRSILQHYLAPYWQRTTLLLVLLLAGAGLTLLSPMLLSAFIDEVMSGGNGMLRLGVLFLIIAFANQAVTIASNYLGTDVGLRATNALRTDLTLHCLELDLDFHNRTTPGALIERIDGDVSLLNQFLSDFAVLLLKNGLLLVGAICAITLINGTAAIVIGLFMLLSLVLLNLIRKQSQGAIRREREASSQLFGAIEERLASTEDMRGNGATEFVLNHFFAQSRQWAKALTWAHMIGSNPSRLAHILYTISLALTLGLVVWLVRNNAITIGAGYAIYRYLDLMRTPIQQIGRQVQEIQQAGASIVRLDELLHMQSAIADTGTTALPAGALSVRFENVSFAYPGQPADDTRNALHECSFELPAGAVLGLLGRTGSGKSSLTRLLLRFYEPQQGQISLGSQPLDQLSIAALRERVGLVNQEVQLFNASVRDNLRLFDPAIADDRLLAAIQAVELDTWFATLPEGLDTVLPPGGGMSAGQAQLLATARVLLRDPGLVILDEASSRLDPATEQHLEHAIDQLLDNRSGIIIAHRLATVQRADLIMVLEDGRCIEFGPRDALAANPESHFAQLLAVGMEEALA